MEIFIDKSLIVKDAEYICDKKMIVIDIQNIDLTKSFPRQTEQNGYCIVFFQQKHYIV